MNYVKLDELYGKNFRRFVEPFRVKMPASGMTLISGINRDTGDSSDSGKSTLVLAISYLFGGCPYAATELQSWHTEEPMQVGAVLETDGGVITVERNPALTIKSKGGKTLRGNAALAELDRIFGMDAALRALSTYRGQGESGRFLSMSDENKKKSLTRALGLDRYEKVSAEAAEQAKALNDKVNKAKGRVEAANLAVLAARDAASVVADRGLGLRCAELEEQAAGHTRAAAALTKQARAVVAKADQALAAARAAVDATATEFRAREQEVFRREESEELKAARAQLEVVKGRLEKVRAVDAEAKTAAEKKRTELRLAAAGLRSVAQRQGAVEADLVEAEASVAALNDATCPTCEQPWTSPECAAALQRAVGRVAEVQGCLDESRAATGELERLRAALGAVSDPAPHQFGPKLVSAERTLLESIRVMAKAEEDAAQATLRAISAEERRDRAEKLQAAEEAHRLEKATAAALEQKATVETETARRKTASAGAARAEEAVRAERARAVVVAEAEQTSAVAAHAETKRTADAELDIHALVGRTGFLGVIFDDVLAEIAAATNDILSRVANVRHITFEFDDDPENKRITPMVRIDGERRPMASGLSGGQGSAVNLAVDLGVGEVVAKRRGSYPGWLVLDESFDGLGRVSKETCLDMLSAYAGERLVLCIDHSTEFTGLFPQVIKVESVDGRARVM